MVNFKFSLTCDPTYGGGFWGLTLSLAKVEAKLKQAIHNTFMVKGY